MHKFNTHVGNMLSISRIIYSAVRYMWTGVSRPTVLISSLSRLVVNIRRVSKDVFDHYIRWLLTNLNQSCKSSGAYKYSIINLIKSVGFQNTPKRGRLFRNILSSSNAYVLGDVSHRVGIIFQIPDVVKYVIKKANAWYITD